MESKKSKVDANQPRSKVAVVLLVAVLLQAAGLVAAALVDQYFRGTAEPETTLFEGVTYQRLQLPEQDNGGGGVHLVRIDLEAPGIELFVSPLDPHAVSRGFQYRLVNLDQLVHEQQLAVAVNGPPFVTHSSWVSLPSDWARSAETLIARGEVNHIGPNSYLVSFDDQLKPELFHVKPPSSEALKRSHWGIGSELIILRDGQINASPKVETDRRSVLGIDSERKLLWLAVFENASYQRAAETLRNQGAKSAIILDGGDSSTLSIGPQARRHASQCLVGGIRPVATVFGVRAKPLPRK